jgi:opacity protein-like surface antigen
MKITFLSLLTLFMFSSGLHATNAPVRKGGRGDGGKLIIGVSVGAGIPMGAYGTADNKTIVVHNVTVTDTSNRNGWAKTGFHFNANIGYKFTDNIGGMLMIGGNMNGFNAAAYDTKNYPHAAGTTTATSHYIGSYLVGPFLNLPVGDKFAITARVLVGLMTAKYADLTETSGALSSVSKVASVSTFGYDAGAGVKIGITDAVGLALNVDYLAGNPTFKSETVTVNSPIGNSSHTYTGTSAMSTSIVNASVGIVLSF